MYQHENPRRGRRGPARTTVLTTAALTVVLLGAGPASARPDPDEPRAGRGHADACFLERVGDQFVRCDDLTGNGVPAPAYIPER